MGASTFKPVSSANAGWLLRKVALTSHITKKIDATLKLEQSNTASLRHISDLSTPYLQI